MIEVEEEAEWKNYKKSQPKTRYEEEQVLKCIEDTIKQLDNQPNSIQYDKKEVNPLRHSPFLTQIYSEVIKSIPITTEQRINEVEEETLLQKSEEEQIAIESNQISHEAYVEQVMKERNDWIDELLQPQEEMFNIPSERLKTTKEKQSKTQQPKRILSKKKQIKLAQEIQEKSNMFTISSDEEEEEEDVENGGGEDKSKKPVIIIKIEDNDDDTGSNDSCDKSDKQEPIQSYDFSFLHEMSPSTRQSRNIQVKIEEEDVDKGNDQNEQIKYSLFEQQLSRNMYGQNERIDNKEQNEEKIIEEKQQQQHLVDEKDELPLVFEFVSREQILAKNDLELMFDSDLERMNTNSQLKSSELLYLNSKEEDEILDQFSKLDLI